MKRTDSYCAGVKLSLCDSVIKRKCCRNALFSAMNYFQFSTENEELQKLNSKLSAEFQTQNTTSQPLQFHCEECRRCFLRGIFLLYGYISSPKSKGYQCELNFSPDCDTSFIEEILDFYGIIPLKTIRQGRNILYYRENEIISDFLNVIGAYKASNDFLNEKIKREFGSEANRSTNCDVANISRCISAANEHIKAIEYIKSSGIYDSLDDATKNTCELRISNPDATLKELALLHDPPITKSGVNHRLNKILSLYKSLSGD